MISNGTMVMTPIGSGEVVGEESFYGGKLWRALVRLDDPSRWAFGNEKDVAAFFEREMTELMPNAEVQPPAAFGGSAGTVS